MGEPDIPMAYGVPMDPTTVSSQTVYSATPVAPTPQRDLRGATSLNGGRSSRVLLPPQSSVKEALSQDVFEMLSQQGFTRGLAESLMTNKLSFPLHFWIVDNSGSMAKQDGHRFVTMKRKDSVKCVPCTRWAEMQQTVDYHAQMAALLRNPTVFRMLNDPGRASGPQQFSVAERGPSFIDEDLTLAQSTVMNTSPNGVTPLTEHLQEIRNNVIAMEASLRSNGTKVAIVIATDGTPTDAQGYASESIQNSFVNALKALEGLPVWIVVRLCTDDDSVVDYWNNLDSRLELSLEVLDDFVSEAKEIHEHNKWLNYGLPIHRMRELGFYHRLFDLLDERKLSKDELTEFFRILFGNEKMKNVSDPQIDWNGFYSSVCKLVDRESKQWNPITKRMAPWIDVRQLKRDYGPGWFKW